VFLNGSGHIEFRGPDAKQVIVPATGHTRGHAGRNYRQLLKRAGVPGAC